MMPTSSPDGQTLAVLVAAADLASKVFLVDVETQEVRELGEPMDTAFLSWLDDGSGLILVQREVVSMALPTRDSVARMDLDGRVTVLRRGGCPVLIPGQNRVLFEQNDQWMTCDLDGKDVELYCGGMDGYGFPAVSADGSRILWMHFVEGKLPQPVVQEYGQADLKTVELGPGFWAYPIWQ